MIFLFVLLVFLNLLFFVYCYKRFEELSKDVSDIYDLIYKKDYDFEISEVEEGGDSIARKFSDGVKRFLDYT